VHIVLEDNAERTYDQIDLKRLSEFWLFAYVVAEKVILTLFKQGCVIYSSDDVSARIVHTIIQMVYVL
jgi:hypothetical protein